MRTEVHFDWIDMTGAIIIGVLICPLILCIIGALPSDYRMRHEKDAVASGHAEWIIETDASGKPQPKFQWKEMKP